MPEVISRDGTRIAYDKIGRGPPVILIDGAFCSREFGPMKKLGAVLAKHFTVISYDRRARGASGDTAPYAVQREIEDIDALMGIAVGRVTLYGVSSGAVLALLAAASLSVSKLAIVRAAVHGGASRAYAACRSHGGAHADDCRGPPQRRREVLHDRNHRHSALRALPVSVPADVEKLKAVAPSLPYDSTVMGDFSIPRAEAAAIAVPTLVMAGTKTWPVLLDAARAAAAAIPHARHETLPGQTHNVAAHAIAPILEAFIKA